MSWKNIVITGLLCVVASPAFAVPSVSSITLVRGPNDPGPADPVLLDANGDFQWQVQVSPDGTLAAGGNGAVAAELAFLIGGAGVTSAANNNAAQWDFSNPGSVPAGFGSGFAWLVLSGANPEGVQFNTTTDEVFAALGSINFTNGDASNVVLISAVGPSKTGANLAPSRTSSVELGGAYAGAGRLAQNGVNNPVTNAASPYVAILGDANLNGVVDLADFNAVINNFGLVGNWDKGNFNNTKGGNVGLTATTVDLADFNDVINNFGDLTPGSGGGSLGASGVPEPASIALVAMAMLAGIAGVRRR